MRKKRHFRVDDKLRYKADMSSCRLFLYVSIATTSSAVVIFSLYLSAIFLKVSQMCWARVFKSHSNFHRIEIMYFSIRA
jgi:hypothetical protein